MRSDDGAAFFERRFLPLVFQTYLAGVVVEELYAGALDSQGIRLVERYVGSLERANRMIAPNFQDWKQAKSSSESHAENPASSRRCNRF
jgi:hypothetical protein